MLRIYRIISMRTFSLINFSCSVNKTKKKYYQATEKNAVHFESFLDEIMVRYCISSDKISLLQFYVF